MLKSLLFTSVLAFSSSYSSLNKAPFEYSHTPQRAYEPDDYNNFRYFIDLFPNSTFTWNDEYLIVSAEVDNTAFSILPDLVLDYFYFGDFGVNNNIVLLEWFQLGSDGQRDGSVPPISGKSFPFVNSRSNHIYNINTFSDIGIPFTYRLVFEFSGILPPPRRLKAQNDFMSHFGFANADGIADYLDFVYDNIYNQGLKDAAASDFNAYGWLTGIFTAMGGLLSIQLLPNVSIGGILILIMVLTLLPFLIGLLKGGKN